MIHSWVWCLTVCASCENTCGFKILVLISPSVIQEILMKYNRITHLFIIKQTFLFAYLMVNRNNFYATRQQLEINSHNTGCVHLIRVFNMLFTIKACELYEFQRFILYFKILKLMCKFNYAWHYSFIYCYYGQVINGTTITGERVIILQV